MSGFWGTIHSCIPQFHMIFTPSPSFSLFTPSPPSRLQGLGVISELSYGRFWRCLGKANTKVRWASYDPLPLFLFYSLSLHSATLKGLALFLPHLTPQPLL